MDNQQQNTPVEQSSQPAEVIVAQPNVSHGNDGTQTLIPTKNKPALLSYYMGIFGLIPLLGLPLSIAAVVLGKKGLNQYKQDPTPGAKGHAMTGLVLGIIQLSVFALFIIFITIITITSPK